MSWILVRHGEEHMATTFEFRVSCARKRMPQAELAIREAFLRVRALERELSEFLPDSPVSRLNAAAAGAPIAVSVPVLELLKKSERIKKRTAGAFDHLAKSMGQAGEIHVSADGRFFSKTTAGTRLSFGAIGKGYAIDEARVILERAGFTDFLLNAGGSSIVISGFEAPGKPWTWAWSWKKDGEGNYLGRRFIHASGACTALGVSGLMEQGEHILDPLKKMNATSAASALVAHGSATDADALSTALFVSGWDGVGGYRDGLHALPAAIIENDETVYWNSDFQSLWGSVCG